MKYRGNSRLLRIVSTIEIYLVDFVEQSHCIYGLGNVFYSIHFQCVERMNYFQLTEVWVAFTCIIYPVELVTEVETILEQLRNYVITFLLTMFLVYNIAISSSRSFWFFVLYTLNDSVVVPSCDNNVIQLSVHNGHNEHKVGLFMVCSGFYKWRIKSDFGELMKSFLSVSYNVSVMCLWWLPNKVASILLKHMTLWSLITVLWYTYTMYEIKFQESVHLCLQKDYANKQ